MIAGFAQNNGSGTVSCPASQGRRHDGKTGFREKFTDQIQVVLRSEPSKADIPAGSNAAGSLTSYLKVRGAMRLFQRCRIGINAGRDNIIRWNVLEAYDSRSALADANN